jgi:acyl carrier protein
MSESNVFSSIEKAIRDVVNNPGLIVRAESSLVNDLGLESIDLLDVSSELENSLGWEVDFREVAEQIGKNSGKSVDMKSIRVQDLMDYIQNRATV